MNNNTAVLDLAFDYAMKEGTPNPRRGSYNRDDNHARGSDRRITSTAIDVYQLELGNVKVTSEYTFGQISYGTDSAHRVQQFWAHLMIVHGTTVIVDATRSYGGLDVASSFVNAEVKHIQPSAWTGLRPDNLDDVVILLSGIMTGRSVLQ